MLAAGLASCAKDAVPATPRMTGHILTDEESGVALDLPRMWAGRYRLSDSLTSADLAVERELTLRFVRADSSLVQAPLLVIRVVSSAGWNALAPDSATRRYGIVVARNSQRVVGIRAASENPLLAGSADAAAFDSLMMIVIQRPMQVSLRR